MDNGRHEGATVNGARIKKENGCEGQQGATCQVFLLTCPNLIDALSVSFYYLSVPLSASCFVAEVFKIHYCLGEQNP